MRSYALLVLVMFTASSCALMRAQMNKDYREKMRNRGSAVPNQLSQEEIVLSESDQYEAAIKNGMRELINKYSLKIRAGELVISKAFFNKSNLSRLTKISCEKLSPKECRVSLAEIYLARLSLHYNLADPSHIIKICKAYPETCDTWETREPLYQVYHNTIIKSDFDFEVEAQLNNTNLKKADSKRRAAQAIRKFFQSWGENIPKPQKSINCTSRDHGFGTVHTTCD